MRVLVTGGAGFLGSHLCDALAARGDDLVCADNLSTGRAENVRHLIGRRGFDFVDADVSAGLDLPGPFDAVAHLASPASPPAYLRRPIETLAVGSKGTENALRLADYWGNVNPIGPRSVYDEAKRFAEALTTAYRTARDVNTGIVRIFNTYGPRMSAGDGRIVTNFVTQALTGRPLTVYGDGRQTRSFCYVDDLIRGIVAMIDSADPGPVNLGNPEEFEVGNFAKLVLSITGSASRIEYLPLPADDPTRRRPVIERAAERLGWKPEISVEEGVRRMADWFRSRPEELSRATA